jgi:hypothetical protein
VARFAEAVLPHGTTTVLIDNHEIANVLGLDGIRWMLEEGRALPLKVLLAVPSCVPALPGFEDAGAVLGPGDIREALGWDGVAALGEMMNMPGVIDSDAETHEMIGAVLDAGLRPTHLDWHCLGAGGRDDVLDLTVSLAGEHGLAVRVWLDPGRQRLRRRGLPVLDHGYLDSFRLDLAGKAARYAELLRALPAGSSEWAVHPGLGDAEARAADPVGWRVRRTDYEFLISPEARALVRQEGIVMTDYRTVQQVWARSGGR